MRLFPRKFAKRGLMAAIGLSVLVTTACGSTAGTGTTAGANATTTTQTAKPPIKIGVLHDASGPLQSYGTQQLNGLKLGLEYATNGTMEVAGRKLELVVKDDASSPDKGVQALRELVEQDKVDILQGTDSSGVILALIPKIEAAKKVMIVAPAAADEISGKYYSKYIFRTGREVTQDAMTGGQFLVADGRKKFINFAPDYAFGHSSADAWSNVIKSYGGTVLPTIYAPQDTKDFTPYLQKLAQSGADGVVVTWAGAGAVTLFQQIGQLKLYDKMLVFTGIGDIPSIKAMGTATAGLVGIDAYYYQLPKNPVNDWLTEHHQKEFGGPPDLFAASGFAAGQAIVKALTETHGDASADKLIPVLEGMTIDSPKGKLTIRKEDHVALVDMYVVKLEPKSGFDYLVPTLVKTVRPEPPIKNTK